MVINYLSIDIHNNLLKYMNKKFIKICFVSEYCCYKDDSYQHVCILNNYTNVENIIDFLWN